MDAPAGYQVGQLTKQLVALGLDRVQNPCAVAAGFVRQTIAVACQAAPDQAEVIVSDACYGGMQGLLLADQDLGCGAVMILGAVAGATDALEPGALTRTAIAGLARAAKFATREQLTDIQRKIERRYSGYGQTFSDAVSAAAACAPA